MKDILKMVVHAGIFAVPFIVLIIANTLFFPYITGKNFAFRIIVEILVASWALLALYDPQYRPKFSWITAAFTGLIGVMFLADILGQHPAGSFWSNFERMEGFVTLIHVYFYYIVVSSMITTEKMWNRLFNTTLAAAVILSLYAFAQLSGNIQINQGGWRLDGTLGNSSYMAIYMLFHIFIAALMFVRTSSRNLKYFYGALALLFIFLLVQTATRGTTLGLAGGALLTTIYIALFAKGYPRMRNIAVGGLIALTLLIGGFVTFRDSALIQSNDRLARIANISLSDLETRTSIWTMAFEGVKERPILGWGQSNYNYVFNKYYDPALHGQEPWFDRVHNIVLDWLITGGVVGASLYFGTIFIAVYYLAIRPLIRKDDEAFTVAERGVVLGLLAGYVFHNLFVFDNIVSYIFFGMVLAFIQSRVGTPIVKLTEKRFDAAAVEQIAAPVVAVALVFVFYFVNVPGMQAAGDIIDAFRATTSEGRVAAFEKAIARNSFGDQEIREQLMQQAISIARDPALTEERKQEVLVLTENELLKQIEEKPGDARVHVFLASFYRAIGSIEKSIAQLEIARELSPRKQQIIFEQGFAYIQSGDTGKALGFFKEAYDLAPDYTLARIFYAAGAIYDGNTALADELINTDDLRAAFAANEISVQALYAIEDYVRLIDLLTLRVKANPMDLQTRVNLAVAYHESGDTDTAIKELKQIIVDIPSFKAQGEQFIKELETGKVPGQPAVGVSGVEVN